MTFFLSKSTQNDLNFFLLGRNYKKIKNAAQGENLFLNLALEQKSLATPVIELQNGVKIERDT